MASQLCHEKMACFATRRAMTIAYAVPLRTTIVRYGRGLRTLAEFPRLTVPRNRIPREISKKYQPFLLDPYVESSDWISKLQLETVATMVQEAMVEDHKRTKVLVIYDSQYPRSPGQHIAYEASRVLHKLGFVVRALDLDSLEDRKVLREDKENKKRKQHSSLKQMPSKDVSAESPHFHELAENNSLVRDPPEKMPQSLPDHESQENAQTGATSQSGQESQAPPTIQEVSNHESNPSIASSGDHLKEEPPGITPELEDPVRPEDKPPTHIPSPENEFFELIMWADAQVWCFPEKTNDLFRICQRHFAERSGPVLQGQPVPTLYFSDSPKLVYQSHAIRYTIGTRRRLVPIPARTDLQGIQAHANQRMSEGRTRNRLVNALEDLAKYTSVLCRKKHEAAFTSKFNNEARAERPVAKSTVLAGAVENVESNVEPQDEKMLVVKKRHFIRLLDLPKKNATTSKPEPEEVAAQEEARKRDQEAKLLRLKKLLRIDVLTGEGTGSKDLQGTENGTAKPRSSDSRH